MAFPARLRQAIVKHWYVGIPILLAAVLAGACAYFLLVYVPDRRAAVIESTDAGLSARADVRLKAVERWVTDNYRDAATVGALLPVRHLVGAVEQVPRGASAGADQHLNETLRLFAEIQGFARVMVLDGRGRVVGRSDSGAPVEPGGSAAVAAAIADGAPHAEFHLHRDGRPMVAFARVIGGGRGGARAAGAVLIEVDPSEWLYPFLATGSMGPTSSEALMIQQDGDSITYLTPLRKVVASPVKYRRPVASMRGSAAVSALEGARESGTYLDYAGAAVFAATRQVAGTRWGLVVKADQADVLVPFRRTMRRVAAGWGATLLAVVVMALLLWRGQRREAELAVVQALAREAAALDQANDMVLFVGLDGRIEGANRRAKEFYGEASGALIGRHVFDLRPPEERGPGPSQLATVRDGGEGLVFETVHLAADGTPVPVEASSRRVALPRGDQIVSVIRDIRERKAAHSSEAKYRALFQQANDAIVVADSESARIVVANPATEALLGMTLAELQETSLLALVAPEDREAAHAAWAATAAGAVLGPTELRVVRPDGTRATVEVRASPFAETDGMRRMVAVVRDVSTRKRADILQRALYRIAETSASATDLKGLCAALHQIVGELTYAGNFFIALVQEDGSLLYPFYVDEHSPPPGKRPPGRTFTEYVIRTGQPLLVDTAAAASLVRQGEVEIVGKPSVAWIGVPLRHGEETLGALVVQSYDETRHYTAADLDLLTFTSRHIADAIARATAQEAVRQREAELRESEERFRRVVEGAPEAVLTFADGKFTYLNPAALRLFGATSAEELIGQPVLEHVSPECRAVVRERMRVLLEDQLPTPPWDEVFLRLDGTTFHVEVSSVPFPHDGRQGVLSFFRDITERKRTTDELALLSTALTQAGEVAFITDTAGTIEYVNPAFERVTGYSAAEAIGQNPRILKSGVQPPEVYRRMWDTLTSGQVFISTLVNRRKNGDHYVAEVIVSPVRDASGEMVRYVGLQRDVTHEHELEEQLRQSQKMEAVGQLTGGIAHDFNNLLGVILANTSLFGAALQGQNPELSGYLADIERAAEAGSQMVKKLLAFGRRERLSMAPLDLGQTLRGLEGILRRFLPETIAIRMDAAVPGPGAMLDAGALEQMVLNLATNARDAMPGGGTLTLALSEVEIREHDAQLLQWIDRPGRYACLSVSDTGTGMDAPTLERIFEPFFTTKPSGAGTGLGLPMIFGLMKQHDGFVRVYSEPGQGTTVRLYFPAAAAGGASAPGRVEAPERLLRGTETILVVEDQEMLRRATARALEKLGYQILVAADGEEGLRMFAAHAEQVRLVLSDRVMPQVGGVEMYQRLRAEGYLVPFLLMSGYAADVGGITPVPKELAVIEKPWTVEALASRIRELLDAPPPA